MTKTVDSPAPLDPYEIAAGFRRLAKLTKDPELAERMMRHADETEQQAAAQPTRARR